MSTLFSAHLFAQKSADKYITFKFIQLPTNPLSNTKYDYVVYQNGEGEEEEVDSTAIQDYEVLKSAYETDINYYYSRVSEIDQQLYEVGESDDLSLIKMQIELGKINNTMPAKPNRPKLNYDDEMELYVMEMKHHNARMDSLNNADMKGMFKEQLRMLMKDNTPVKPLAPSQKAKGSGLYELPDALVAEIMQIRGLDRVTNDLDRVFFEVSLSKFELKEEKKDDKGEQKLIWQFRRIAGYKVYDENNVLLEEGMAPGTDKWRKKEISLATQNKEGVAKEKKDLEKSSSEMSLYSIKYCLGSKFGKLIENGRAELYYAKGKDYNYDALTEAFELSRNIFENSLKTENPDLSDFNKAIDVWKEELKEADYSNKKARINQKIALGLNFNIIQASIWLNDFDQVFSTLDELSKMDLKSSDKNLVEFFREFAIDQKQRVEANKSLNEVAKM